MLLKVLCFDWLFV